MKRLLILFLSFFLFLPACDQIEGMFATDIGEILENPGQYAGQEVTIKGEVTRAINIFGLQFYKVKDETGEIYVIPNSTTPDKGMTVLVDGTVKEFVKIRKIEVIAIKEKRRR